MVNNKLIDCKNVVLCSSIPGENGFNFGVQERCGKSIFVLSQYQVLAYLIPQIKQQPHNVKGI